MSRCYDGLACWHCMSWHCMSWHCMSWQTTGEMQTCNCGVPSAAVCISLPGICQSPLSQLHFSTTRQRSVGLNHFAAHAASSPCCPLSFVLPPPPPWPCWYAIDMKQLSFMQSTLMIFYVMIMRPLASFTFSLRLVLHLNILLLASSRLSIGAEKEGG